MKHHPIFYSRHLILVCITLVGCAESHLVLIDNPQASAESRAQWLRNRGYSDQARRLEEDAKRLPTEEGLLAKPSTISFKSDSNDCEQYLYYDPTACDDYLRSKNANKQPVLRKPLGDPKAAALGAMMNLKLKSSNFKGRPAYLKVIPRADKESDPYPDYTAWLEKELTNELRERGIHVASDDKSAQILVLANYDLSSCVSLSRRESKCSVSIALAAFEEPAAKPFFSQIVSSY